MIIPSGRRALPIVLALVAAAAGLLVAVYYHRLGLTLSHYDARGHLIVARRIVDSITPGWQQIGAVWLPLPHVLNAIPVQVDVLYRSGASAVAISVVAYAIAVGAIAWIVLALTGSALAAAAGAAVFALNPNVLYLQATPMTEPLLLALTTLGVAMLMDWCAADGPPRATVATIGVVLALACLTRYEAWPVTAAALTAATWVRWQHHDPWPVAVRKVAAIAVYPTVAILAFALFSRVVVGAWFVTDGFFVPENVALGHPWDAAAQIGWGTRVLSGPGLLVIGGLGAAILLARSLMNPRRAHALVALSLLAMAAVPWYAFVKGHPFRVRYMVPLIALEAVGAGVAAGVSRRIRIAGAIVVLAAIAYELRPLDLTAPMVVEAQWDRPNTPVRATVTACMGQPGSHETIMASMGSLGHYMQEASHAGYALRDFLHEGNGDIWLAALRDGPRPYVPWVLIEEKAEGGDMLAARARQNPHFLDGYSRVCEGAGLALYKRASP